MVGSVGSTSNLINMISVNYQNGSMNAQGPQGAPPPPPSGNAAGSSEDPLGIFDSVDADANGAVSEAEYDILTQGIQEITGSEFTGSFLDFDTDGDGQLNGTELRSVLDEAGFTPPPPPPRQVISSYETQGGEISDFITENDDQLTQLLDYLENHSKNFDITA